MKEFDFASIYLEIGWFWKPQLHYFQICLRRTILKSDTDPQYNITLRQPSDNRLWRPIENPNQQIV